MNTIDLVKCLNNSPTTKHYFKGVFPCNHLPVKILKPGFVIANTDVASKSGTHWVSFYFPKKGPAEYFDSFGVSPVFNKHFLKFLQQNCSSYITNTKRLQGDFSTTCGHYCCVYSYYRCNGKHMKDFVKKFSKKNFNMNDNKIINMYMKCFDSNFKKKTKFQHGGVIICNQTCKSKIKK